MKKILFCILLLLFLGYSKPVYAETLGAGLFCDKHLHISDGKLVFDYEKISDSKYVKGDIVSCYLSIYYDGPRKYNSVSFVIGKSDSFKFDSFEKASVWDSETLNENKFSLKTNKELSGSMIVGILKYEMLVDGDDLEIPIKEFYINDYDAAGGEFFGIVNDSSGEIIFIPDEEKEEKPDEKWEYEEADVVIETDEDDSKIYTYILISLVMLIFIFVLYIIKNYVKDKRMFD